MLPPGLRITLICIARDGGVHVAEEAQTGAITAPPLMKLADQVQAGELTTEAAITHG